MSFTNCDLCGESWKTHTTACKQTTVVAPVGTQPAAVSSGEWIDALAKRWERTADELFTGLAFAANPRIHAQDDVASRIWRQAAKELRACVESASIDGTQWRPPAADNCKH